MLQRRIQWHPQRDDRLAVSGGGGVRLLRVCQPHGSASLADLATQPRQVRVSAHRGGSAGLQL